MHHNIEPPSQKSPPPTTTPGKFYLVAANLPMISWHIYQVQTIPRGNIGLYDPTEIFNRRMVRKYVRDCLISVGFYLIMFFVYVYW